MSTLTATRIGLQVHCADPTCTEFAWPLLQQLSSGYDECAVLDLRGLEVWRDEHRTARKRADRAKRRDYEFGTIKRHNWAQDIYAINTSATYRQGREMSAGYQQPPSTEPLPNYPCSLHGVHSYGVFDHASARLVAYTFIYRSGDLALVSQILGHAAHLANEIMYLLVQGVVAAESQLGGYLTYNRYDSGTDGLRFFKDRCGFERTQVEWSQW
jgi:hypothetical protein